MPQAARAIRIELPDRVTLSVESVADPARVPSILESCASDPAS
jgi:hypothetical protein